jgi:hypothetical protein
MSLDTPVLRYSGTQVLRYSGTQILRYSDTQVLRYSGTQVLRYSGTQVLRYPGTQALGYFNHMHSLYKLFSFPQNRNIGVERGLAYGMPSDLLQQVFEELIWESMFGDFTMKPLP